VCLSRVLSASIGSVMAFVCLLSTVDVVMYVNNSTAFQFVSTVYLSVHISGNSPNVHFVTLLRCTVGLLLYQFPRHISSILHPFVDTDSSSAHTNSGFIYCWFILGITNYQQLFGYAFHHM